MICPINKQSKYEHCILYRLTHKRFKLGARQNVRQTIGQIDRRETNKQKGRTTDLSNGESIFRSLNIKRNMYDVICIGRPTTQRHESKMNSVKGVKNLSYSLQTFFLLIRGIWLFGFGVKVLTTLKPLNERISYNVKRGRFV